MTGPPPTLAFLAYHWGDLYLLSSVRDQWVALRRDARYFLVADSLTGLETLISADYKANPVGRDYDPPGEAADFTFPGTFTGSDGQNLDDDARLDAWAVPGRRPAATALPFPYASP